MCDLIEAIAADLLEKFDMVRLTKIEQLTYGMSVTTIGLANLRPLPGPDGPLAVFHVLGQPMYVIVSSNEITVAELDADMWGQIGGYLVASNADDQPGYFGNMASKFLIQYIMKVGIKLELISPGCFEQLYGYLRNMRVTLKADQEFTLGHDIHWYYRKAISLRD